MTKPRSPALKNDHSALLNRVATKAGEVQSFNIEFRSRRLQTCLAVKQAIMSSVFQGPYRSAPSAGG